MPVSSEQRELLLELHNREVVVFGLFRTKRHREHPCCPSSYSPVYLNFRGKSHSKPGPLTPGLHLLLGAELYRLSRQLGISYDHVVGIPEAGTPLATAFIQAAESGGVYSQLFLEKDPETQKVQYGVRGRYSPGDEVLLLDDVLSGGDSKREALKALQEGGLRVTEILVLVDRQEGGKETLPVTCRAAFQLSEILDLYVEERLTTPDTRERVKDYARRMRTLF